MPIHINNLKKEPERDIYITGSPRFLQDVGMGESRYAGSTDKYASVMSLFEGGIYFDMPACNITNEAAVQTKVNRFRDSTATETPTPPPATDLISSINPRQHRLRLHLVLNYYRRFNSNSMLEKQTVPARSA